MADTAVQSSQAPATATASKKKTAKKEGKQKKPRSVSTHPKVSEMVNNAISSLKERGGSSLQAIKKYISAHYKVDIERLSPFIKKYLKTSVSTGALVQTKGKGASGSFRMSAAAVKTKDATVKKPVKRSAVPKPKPIAKKAPRPKKAGVKKVTKKKSPEKKSVKKAKSPTKPKFPKAKKAKPTARKPAAKKVKK